MATTKNLTSDEKSELLRYLIGTADNGYVPFMQDNRYRELLEQFRGTDDRTNDNSDDPRVSPYAAEPAEVEATNKSK